MTGRSTVCSPGRANSMNAEKPFLLDDMLVDPVNGLVLFDGMEVKLEPRMMDVLVYLARHSGTVVSREELEQVVWKGRIVGYDALTGTMRKLRKILHDDARQPRLIETVPKKGYRLLVPVSEQTSVEKPPVFQMRSKTGLSIVAAISLLIVTLFIVNKMDDAEQPGNEPYTIAVLPFINLSGNITEEYFVDGITDDLITELAKNPGLFVIARDSSFIYKNSTMDIREIASKLGVHYILHGSVRQADEKLRLNAQLILADDGRILWADNFNGKLGNVFALQDKITDKIITSLASGMSAHRNDTGSVTSPVDFEAYDYFLHGRNRFFRYASKEDNQKARELYKKAIELDDDFAMAHAMLAWTYAFDAMNGWSRDRQTSLNNALQSANDALSRDVSLPVAYFVSGLVYRELGEFSRAKIEAKKALSYDSNYANAYVLLATLLYYTGEPEAGLEKIKLAMRLNPHHPYNYPFHMGQAYFILKRYDEAIAAFEQGLESNPSSERMRVWLAAAYAKSNRLDDARWESEQVLALNPDFDLEKIKQAFPFREADDLKQFVTALELAGLDD